MKRKFTFLMAAFTLLAFLVPITGWGQATIYTSNVTLPQSGTNVSSCKVGISGTQYDGTKLGKSNTGASANVTIPAGTTTLYVHCAAWNGKTSSLALSTTASGVTISPNGDWNLTSDTGINGNSPFTLNNTNNASTEYFREYSLTGVTSNITVKFEAKNERAVFWGVNASAGSSNTPSITINSENIEFTAAESEVATTTVTYTNLDERTTSIGLYEDAECTTSVTGLDNFWFTAVFATNNDETIEYFAAENEGTEPRTVYMRVEATDGEEVYTSNVITVTQAAPVILYTVSFELGGGTFVPNSVFTDDVVELEAGTYALPSVTKANHIFVGWNDGTTTYAAGVDYTVSGDVEFTAQYVLGVMYNFAGANNFYTDEALTTHPGSGNGNNVGTIYYGDGSMFVASGTTRYFSNVTSGYFILGKADATLSLPTIDGYDITQVKLHSSSGHSKSVAVSIVSGDNTASDAQIWSTQNYDYVYDISEDYQTSALSVKVTNAYNAQFTSITLVLAAGSTTPRINANDVSIDFDVVSGNIAYDIINPVNVGVLTATTDDEWLTLGTIGTTVPFSCTPNTAYTARTATVTLTYTYGEESVTKDVTITQGAVPEPSFTLAPEAVNVSADGGQCAVVFTLANVSGTIVAINTYFDPGQPEWIPNNGGINYTTLANISLSPLEMDSIYMDSIYITVDQNNTIVSRSVEIWMSIMINGSYTQIASNRVTITQAASIPTYTVNFDLDEGTFVPNTDFPTASVEKEAGTYTLPSATKEGNIFAGWYDGTDTYAAGAQYQVSDDVDFTAQWTEISGNYYAMVTESLEDWSGVYIFTGYNNNSEKYYAMKKVGTIGTNSVGISDEVTVEDNIIVSNQAIDSCRVLVTKVGNNYTLYMVDYEYYLVYNSGNTLNSSNSIPSDGSGNWTISIDENNLFTITNVKSNTRVMRYNTSSPRFACYTTTTGVLLNLFKFTGTMAPAISAADVNVPFNAEEGVITYGINNPVTGGTMSASTTSDWLTIGTVDETVLFTCSVNPTGAARMATVTLTYAYGEESVTKDVTVTQALNPNVTMTIAEVRALATGHVVTTGIITSITGTNNKTAYMQDATAAIAIYGNFEAAVGDEVKVSGNLQTYKGLLEIGSNNNPPTVQVLSNGNTVAPTIKTIAEINADDYTSSNSIQGLYVTIENATVTGTMLVNGQYTTTIAQGENTIDVFGNLGVDVDLYDVLTLNGNIGCNNAAQIANPSNVEVASSGFNYYYSVNGELGDVLQGTDITLANSDAVGGLAFVGWTLDPNNVETILPAGDPYTITEENAGIVFYAVYSRSVDMADHTYVKITEEPEDWSGNYLIVYEDGNVAFNGGLQILDAENNTINVSINGDNIEGDYTTNAAVFTIAPIVDNEQVTGYSIKSRSGFYIGQTSNANGMKAHTSTVYNNSISYNVEEGIVDIISAGAYMRYNSSSGQERFRYFRSGTYSNQKAIQLYKQEGEAVLSNSYYTRVFANETATANIEIVGPSVIPSDYSLNMDTYTLTNELGAASLVIEEGGQLIHSVEENIVYVTMQKHINRYYGEKDNYYLISAPFYVDPTVVTGMLDNNYDFYVFASGMPGAEWHNYKADEGFVMWEGQGFLYANSVDTDLEFVGQVAPSTDNDFYYGGLYQEGSTDPFNGWSLAGNPFACNAYPVLNDGTAASFYKISGDELVLSEENYMRPLEGIFMQETDESTQYFFNRTEPAPSRAIDLTVMSVARGTANCDRVRVRFDNGNNFGKFQLNPNHTKLYFSQGNKDYAVVRSANEGEMPLNFKAETNGTYTISVNAENVNMSYLHLIDNVTGADVDLLSTPSYSFEANTNDYATRFRLVFKANANVSENVDAVTFAFFNGSTWTISNVGEATLQVVDVMGRVLSSETINGNAEISINQTPGVYMLRLINGDNVKTQKVVVR